jgi:Transposase DDE domain
MSPNDSLRSEKNTMRLLKVLHTKVLSSVPTLHAKRAAALTAAVHSLLSGAFLTVTALGRRLNSPALTKHNIKRMDRLLSNSHLHAERMVIYRAVCHHLCQHLSRPFILVDWSDIVEQNRLLMIRAALVVEGRAIPLYEAVYPLEHYNSPRTHRRFLAELKTLLPAHCTPIIITDAGFRGPWFAAVEKLGWDWIGRVRNCVNYRLKSRHTWHKSTALYPRATATPVYLGHAELSSKCPYACHLHLYKKPRQHQLAKRSVVHFAKHSTSEVFAKQQRDPWLIATNLPPQQFGAAYIMALYGKRMQIESGLRDLKSDQFGFGLTLSRSRDIYRLNSLLLIATLATLCLWWIGLYARAQGWHRQFQANTVIHRHVLSALFLGLEVVKRFDGHFKRTELSHAHRLLLSLIATAHES